jgi:hypothetical protein
MESRYFSWDGWEQTDTMEMIYYKCVVKYPFGPYKKGDKIRCITLNYGEAKWGEYDDDGSVIREGKMMLVME